MSPILEGQGSNIIRRQTIDCFCNVFSSFCPIAAKVQTTIFGLTESPWFDISILKVTPSDLYNNCLTKIEVLNESHYFEWFIFEKLQ